MRQELSHALYQHDAACRVIARLIKERDEARSLLLNQKTRDDGMITEETKSQVGLTEKIVKEVNEKAVELNTMRKERKKNPDQFLEHFPNPDLLSNWQLKSTVSLHDASKPGITAMDIDFSRQVNFSNDK